METSNKTVLITGASSGIGKELAKQFARDKFNMVIVSRDAQALQDVAEMLRTLGAGDITILPKDLSVPGSAAEVYEDTQRRGITVNVLVNDAGMGEAGPFVETDLNKELDIIQLNISSLVHLTKLYLRDMVARNEGRVLNLASVASYQPTPYLTVYAATKAFVLSFTDALIREMKDTKVTLTALIPGPTDTDFFNKAGMENTRAAQDPEDPEVVAKIGYEALMKGEHHAVAPGVKTQIMMSSLMPNDNVAAMAEKQMEEVDEDDREKK